MLDQLYFLIVIIVYFELVTHLRASFKYSKPSNVLGDCFEVIVQDITLQEAETTALSILKQVMEEKEGIFPYYFVSFPFPDHQNNADIGFCLLFR